MRKSSSIADSASKIAGAQFRVLNERLYTADSHSVDLTSKDYELYIAGYQKQKESWPVDPLQEVVKLMEQRDRIKELKIADVGCGEAQLVKIFPNVTSYDKFSQFEIRAARNKMSQFCCLAQCRL